MLSRTAAIRQARELIGALYHVGSGPTGWGYNTWDETRQLWHTPCSGTDYHRARTYRAESIAECAARMMLESRGWDPVHAGAASWMGDYHSWPGIEAAVDSIIERETK